MRNLPVHWSEGMFLRPHHFQAADRYWTEAHHASEQWDHAYNYGLRDLDISKDAIGNYQVQVSLCHARMKDGTLVSLDPGQEPDRADLKEAVTEIHRLAANLESAFVMEPVVRVFLAVPKLKLGSANVGDESDGSKQRFARTLQSLQDESTGGNDQELQLKQLNVRLLLSTQDLSGYELLPLAQIQRSSEREAAPQIDPDYFPPLLSIDAWPPLGRDIVRALYDIIGRKIEVLSEQVVNRGITLVSQEPGDLDRLMMLTQLNEASATLRVIAFAAGVHPFVAYTELCRILGRLSIFGEERRPPEIPLYDHDDLARIFKYVKEQIELLLRRIQDYEYEQRFFEGVGLGMQVTLEPKWLNSDWQWYVGVRREDITEKECRDLLSPGFLDWKFGSSRQVEILFRHRAEGLQLIPADRTPRALPAHRDWIYFQVTRQNAAWKDVLETTTLAMRFKDTLIANRDNLQGKRSLVINMSGKEAKLQIALFAVKVRS